MKNITELFSQMSGMKKKMEDLEKELAEIQVKGEAYGGMVVVTANGNKKIINISIDSSLLNEKKELVENVIYTAVNDALEKASKIEQDKKMALASSSIPFLSNFSK